MVKRFVNAKVILSTFSRHLDRHCQESLLRESRLYRLPLLLCPLFPQEAESQDSSSREYPAAVVELAADSAYSALEHTLVRHSI